MYSAIIKYLTGKIESLNAISKVYGLGNIVSYNGEEYPSVISNGENVHVNFDLFKSLSFILKNGNVSRTTDEHPFLANAEKVTQVYPLRLIIYSQNRENENCESLSQQIADYVSAQLSGYQSQFVSELGLDTAKITVNSKNTDKYAVWEELYSVEHRLKEQDVLISIDFEFEVIGDETCFTTAPCETSEFSFDFGRTTFCDRVDTCLGISESGDENKYLNEKGEWIEVGGGAVDSVNGQTGVVVLDADDIDETVTRFWLTDVLKAAYDAAVSWIATYGANLINHLSNTSNPHSTTAAQVGAYTTSQVDDIFDGATKTIARSAVSYSHTGSTGEVKVHSLLIPANTFAVGDIMRLVVRFTKTGTANTWKTRVRVGTADDLTGDLIRESAAFAATIRYASTTKVGLFKATNNVEFYTSGGISDEDVQTSTPNSITTFDPTVANYLVFSVDLVSGSADTAILSGYYLQKI